VCGCLARTCVGMRRPDGQGRVGFGRRPCRDETERGTSLCHSRPYPPGRHPALLFPHSFGARRKGGREEQKRALPTDICHRPVRDFAGVHCRSGFSRDRGVRRSRLKPLLQCDSRRSGDRSGHREGRNLAPDLLFPLPRRAPEEWENQSAKRRPGGDGRQRHMDVPRPRVRQGRLPSGDAHCRQVGAPQRKSAPSLRTPEARPQ